jgi:translation initiation factor IF-2
VTARRATLQDLLRRTGAGVVTELNIIVKADVQGSVQALEDSLLKLPQEEVRVNIVRGGAGGITENDVTLAMASDAIIVGFNVRPSAGARDLAEREGVDIRTYRVIYDAIDDIKSALSGLLKPEERERVLGEAEVRQVFRVPRLGVIAGSYIRSGTIRRNSRARLVRDGVVVYDGRVASLRRFKDDVAEVREGYECGIGLENFQDIKDGDIVEAYDVEEVARSI